MRKIITEIPIYAFSPEEYKKRCAESYRRKFHYLITKGYSVEGAQARLGYSGRRPWRYFPLVGMFCLYIKDDDSIYIGLYCKDGKLKRSISTDYNTSFPDRCTDVSVKLTVFNDDSNDDIKRKIKARIKDLQSLEQIEKFYIDFEAFDNISEAVNFKKLLNFE